LATWHCILSAELIKTHSLRLLFGDFTHWDSIPNTYSVKRVALFIVANTFFLILKVKLYLRSSKTTRFKFLFFRDSCLQPFEVLFCQLGQLVMVNTASRCQNNPRCTVVCADVILKVSFRDSSYEDKINVHKMLGSITTNSKHYLSLKIYDFLMIG